MKIYVIAAVCALIITTGAFLLPERSRAAEVEIGATVWYSWWEPYWTQVSDSIIVSSYSAVSNFSGGPLLKIRFNDTWSIATSYTYGRYEGTASGILPAPLFYFIEQPYDSKREAKRHDFDFLVSGSVNTYMKIFGGVTYSGYEMNTKTSILAFTFLQEIFHHFAGPAIGAGFTIPLISTPSLKRGVGGVFQFSSFVAEPGNAINDSINSIFGGTKKTLMYAGLNITLSLAYAIQRTNVTLVLGGRFQYLWIEKVRGKNFPAAGT